MQDPSSAVWLAARLRHVVETLLQLQVDAEQAGLDKTAANLADSALKVARAYQDLIKIASQPFKPPAKEHLSGPEEQLPF